MTTELRQTVLSVVSDLPWGTHFCHFYETKEDLLDILVPYFKAGLENNEFCLWVVFAPLNVVEATAALRRAAPETDAHLAAGRIQIVADSSSSSAIEEASLTDSMKLIPRTQGYLKDGVFNAKRMIDGWREKLDEALAKGYAGMRANGNEVWLTKEHWKDFSLYEKALDEAVAGQPLIVLCSYPLSGASAAEILDVAETHNFAVAKRNQRWEILENPGFSRPTPPVFFASPAPQVIFQRSDGRCVEANHAFVQLLGYERAELIGRTSLEVGLWMNPEDRAALWEMLRLRGAVRDYETRVRTKSDRILDIAVFMASIQVAGKPCLLATLFDITERKRIEQELKQSESLLAEAQRLAHIGSWSWDVETDTHIWSDEVFRIYGFQPEEFAPSYETFLRMMHPEDRELINRVVQNSLRTHEPFSYHYRISRPEGVERILYSRGNVATDEQGQRVRMFGTVQDVTERKRAEEQQKIYNERLRAFSARLQAAREEEGARIAREIHDELGSALTSLRWDLESLEKALSETADAPQLETLRAKVADITRQTETTINTVRRIASELRPSVLDDLGLMEALEWQSQQFQTRTGITCVCDCSAELMKLNREHSTTIFRIFQEALTNILRHAQASRVEISAREEADHFVLIISDNGRGITEAEMSAPQSLGLLGMRERAALVGGEIEIKGETGRGTVVTVRIPISE